MHPAALREMVLAGFDSLGIEHRALSAGVLDVTLPRGLWAYFGSKRRLRLVFDHDVWQADRRAQLVAPGSGVLRSLEGALRDSGAAFVTLVGGRVVPGDKLSESWKTRIKVLNGTLLKTNVTLRHRPLYRFLFEVDLPGPPPVTELIPVVCHGGGLGILNPEEVASLNEASWYTPDELTGLGHGAFKLPNRQDIAAARTTCRAEVARRLAPVISDQVSERSAGAAEEKRRLKAEFRRRASEMTSQQDLVAAQEEQERRLALVDRMVGKAVEVRERMLQVLHVGEECFDVTYDVLGEAQPHTFHPALNEDLLRYDQCAACSSVQHEYYVWPSAKTSLICSTCATLCTEDGCHGIITRDTECCHLCPAPVSCSRHNLSCATCGGSTCSQHRVHAACCGSLLCDSHIIREYSTGEALCANHARRCSIDGEMHLAAAFAACPVTRKEFFEGNGVRAAWEDERLLHPAALVKCASTGVMVAHDRAIACVLDKKLHRPDQIVSCGKTAEPVCPRHRGTCDDPHGLVVRSDRIWTCTKTGKLIDMSRGATCTVDGERYHLDWVAVCPLTGKQFFRENGVQPAGDDRLLHPAAVIECASTRTLVARDRSGTCVEDEKLHRKDALKPCSITGDWVCKAHLVSCDQPENVSVRASRVLVCAATGQTLDRSVAAKCDVTGKHYFRQLVKTCPVTRKRFYVPFGIVPDGDDRVVHPEAIVKCSASGRLVARDKARWDRYGGGAPLHPDAAVKCELSEAWTARASTTLSDCCGRLVSNALIGRSTYSGRIWCREHHATCAKDGADVVNDELRECRETRLGLCPTHYVVTQCNKILDQELGVDLGNDAWGCTEHFGPCGEDGKPTLRSELKRCDVTGRPLCPDHRVVTECDRTINRKAVFRLPGGGWGCSRHYCLCTAGDHVVLRTTALRCETCTQLVCNEHISICACHGQNHHGEHLRVNPYAPSELYCAAALLGCERCGLVAPQESHGTSGSLCAECTKAQALAKDTPLGATYLTFVKPRLPWYQVRLDVSAAGNDHVATFELRTLTGRSELFRVHGGGAAVVRKRADGTWEELV